MKRQEIFESLTEGKNDYAIYHNLFSDAMREVEAFAAKQGYEVDSEDYASQVAHGPSKPKTGKTNRYVLQLNKNGQKTIRKLQVQVYGMDSGKFELNMYIGR